MCVSLLFDILEVMGSRTMNRHRMQVPREGDILPPAAIEPMLLWKSGAAKGLLLQYRSLLEIPSRKAGILRCTKVRFISREQHASVAILTKHGPTSFSCAGDVEHP
jgi:hypothetical protein